MPEDKTTIVIDARIRGSESVEPGSAWVWKALDYLVGFLPSHRETRQGRKTAKQVRIAMIGIGIAMMAFGGAESAVWIILGVLLAASAFAVPVPELKKRSWRAKFKKKRSPKSQVKWTPGTITFDGRRVELRQNRKKLRHILVDRDKHSVVLGKYRGDTCMGIQAPGKRKKETIWVCTPEVVDVEADEKIDESQVDHPAEVDAAEWRQLWEGLGKGKSA